MYRLPDVRLRLCSALAAFLAAAACAPPDAATSDALNAAADSVVASWIDSGRIPGAVLLVRRGGDTVFERAYGLANVDDSVPMTTETVFDLASVTKVMASTLSAMYLVDRDLVDVDAAVSDYLPDFTGGGKESITLRHLLTHRAGLYQWQPTYYHASNAEEAYAYIRDLPLAWPVGEGRHYSDLGFMLMGRIVEQVSGQALDDFTRERLYEPLGLALTGFRRRSGSASQPPPPIAATSHGNPFERRMVHDPDFGYLIEGDPDAWDGWRTHTLVGEVNDGNAFHAFGGVAGHAGLFAPAADLGVIVQMLLDGGTVDGRRLLSEDVIRLFMQPTGDGQALGWQLPAYAPEGSFGHTGFTGTFVLGVPSQDLAIVLLTNRQAFGVDENTTYPDVGPLQRAVTAALTAPATDRPGGSR